MYIEIYKRTIIAYGRWEVTQEELRQMLSDRYQKGTQAYISKETGINKDILSRFKTGKIDLYPDLFNKLVTYLQENT